LSRFLLDTNTCIYLLNGKYHLDNKIAAIGERQCSLSEITVAELLFGAENSERIAHNVRIINEFVNRFQILPIFPTLHIYAKEKTRLRKAGTPIDEFDLLIAATAITNNLILVTNNTKHFTRFKNIKLENWAN